MGLSLGWWVTNKVGRYPRMAQENESGSPISLGAIASI